MTAFKPFQIRWREPLGDPKAPYCYRWSLVLFGYSFRIHHWTGKQQEPQEHNHNHPFDFISIVIKGSYYNTYVTEHGHTISMLIKAPSIWSSKAATYHHLTIPPTGAWTILLCGRPYVKWGFNVNGSHWRPSVTLVSFSTKLYEGRTYARISRGF